MPDIDGRRGHRMYQNAKTPRHDQGGRVALGEMSLHLVRTTLFS
jgi:hypothetical protein